MATDELRASAQAFIEFTSSDEYIISPGPDDRRYNRDGDFQLRNRTMAADDLKAIAISAALWKVKEDPSSKKALQEWTQGEVDEVMECIWQGTSDQRGLNEWDRDMSQSLVLSKPNIPQCNGDAAGKLIADASCSKDKEGNTNKRKRKTPCKEGVKGKTAYLFEVVKKDGTVATQWRCGSNCAVSKDNVRETETPEQIAKFKQRFKNEYNEALGKVVDRQNTKYLLWHMRQTLYIRSHPQRRRSLQEKFQGPPTRDLDVLRSKLMDFVRAT